MFLFVKNGANELGQMEISVQRLPDDDTPNIYIEQRDDYKPLIVREETWDVVWANFRGYVGESMETLQACLSKVTTTMSLSGHRTALTSSIIRYLINVANGYLTGKLKHSSHACTFFWFKRTFS